MLNINKQFVFITVIFITVILISLPFFSEQERSSVEEIEEANKEIIRNPLNGLEVEEDYSLFVTTTVLDNAYDIRPQAGLKQAAIVYEALVEGNITRLLAIYDSNNKVNKIGPIRSARNYFMDWAEEYQGLYMHVGGSPQALGIINSLSFTNIDEMGSNEIYFWRDNNYLAPHNVFTSSANFLRAGELKEVTYLTDFKAWNFQEGEEGNSIYDIIINFSNDYYRVEWEYNDSLQKYERKQGGDKFIYNTGEQVKVDNIIVQIVNTYFIDEERRGMDTKEEGKVYIFNKLGKQEGLWKYIDNRTIFLNEEGAELILIPGQTWVEIIDSEEKLIY